MHPLDPWQPEIGGYGTFLPDLLREMPADWELEIVGLTRDPVQRPAGTWRRLDLAGRSVRFFAVLSDPPGRPRRSPLALRFTLACRRLSISTTAPTLHFHRFETALAFPRSEQRQVLFLHYDPAAQRQSSSHGRWRRLAWLHDRLLLRVARRMDRIWCVDAQTPAWLDARLPARASRHRPVGLWARGSLFTASGRPEEEAAWRERLAASPVEDGAPWILWAARLEHQKDPLLMVEAFALLAATHPGAHLILAGGGSLTGAVRARARALGLERQIHELGPISRAEVASLLRLVRLFVCTSRYESGPFSVLEALSCGCPVVSRAVGRVPEWLSGDRPPGRLVAEHTPQAVAEAMTRALADHQELASRCGAVAALHTAASALEPVVADERAARDAARARGERA